MFLMINIPILSMKIMKAMRFKIIRIKIQVGKSINKI